MAKKETPLTSERIEKLLSEQTRVILNAVDEKLSVTEIRMSADVDKKLVLMEERINRKFDKLTTTLPQIPYSNVPIRKTFRIPNLWK